MNPKLIRQLTLYSLPILAYFVMTYTAQPVSAESRGTQPLINIIPYPDGGPNARPESGYISAYYALQKLGEKAVEDRKAFFLSSKNTIKKSRLLEAAKTQINNDLTGFIAKNGATPAASPIPGISSQDLKDIIESVLPDISQEIAQEYIKLNFNDATGELSEKNLEVTGIQLFERIIKQLHITKDRYQKLYKINGTMLEPDLTKNGFQILKEFTGLRDTSKLKVIKKPEVLDTLHKIFPNEEGPQKDAEATGNWLLPNELTSLIAASTKDADKVMILSDLGLLVTPGPEGADRTQEIVQIFDRIKRKMAQVEHGTETFIIDKAYVRGKPAQSHVWVPIIVNKQGDQLRLVIIDPENQITTDNPYVKILLKHLA